MASFLQNLGKFAANNDVLRTIYNTVGAPATGGVPLADPSVTRLNQGYLGDPNGSVGPKTSQPQNTQNSPLIDESGAAGVDATGGAGAAAYSTSLADLNAQEGRIGGQLNIANQNILDQYNASIQKLINQKNQAEGQYNTSRANTMQDNQTAKSRIDQGVGQQYTGIQRLLGARGAGNSSASQIAAPYAAGLVGNQQRQDVNKQYATNMAGLDTNWNQFNTDWNDKQGETNTWRENQLRQANSNALDTRARLLAAKAQLNPANAAGYQAQIQDLGSQIDALGRVSVYNPGNVVYKAPDLQAYGYQTAGGPTQGNALQQALGPYYTLLGEDKKNQDQLAGQSLV